MRRDRLSPARGMPTLPTVGSACRGACTYGGAYFVAAAAVDCAAASASFAPCEPLSAACIAVHIAWEILGYRVPRLSLVRPLATWTASTQTFRSGAAATCLPCTT